MTTAPVAITNVNNALQTPNSLKSNAPKGILKDKEVKKIDPEGCSDCGLKVFAVALIVIGVAALLTSAAFAFSMLFPSSLLAFDAVFAPVVAVLSTKWAIVAAAVTALLGAMQLTAGILSLKGNKGEETNLHELAPKSASQAQQNVPMQTSVLFLVGTKSGPDGNTVKNLIHLEYARESKTFVKPIICRLTTAQSLKLNNNELIEVPDEIGNLTNLYILNLSDNKLENLPSSIANLKKLFALDLGKNKIKLPEEFSQLSNLKILDLTHNEMDQLPENFYHLQKLKKLNLSINKFKEVPECVTKLPNLEALNLSENEIEQLPKELINLKKIKELKLSGNKLTELPEWISELTNLEKLDISGNNIAKLPVSVGKLKNLRALNISKNPIKDPLPETLSHSNLPKLIVTIEFDKKSLIKDRDIPTDDPAQQHRHSDMEYYGSISEPAARAVSARSMSNGDYARPVGAPDIFGDLIDQKDG